jgi:hypothetical protein
MRSGFEVDSRGGQHVHTVHMSTREQQQQQQQQQTDPWIYYQFVVSAAAFWGLH